MSPVTARSPARTFRFRAVGSDGAKTTGTIAAASQAHAVIILQERGLFPTDVQVVSGLRGRRTIPLGDLALGLRMLANLLESGLSVGRSLAAFSELAPKSWAPALAPVRDAVRGGQTLAGALAAAPVEIPPLVIGILQAGEAGTGIAPAARRVAETMEHAAATRAAIRGALAYPLVLAVAGTASVALLVGVVLPRFAVILGGLNQHIPPTTHMVLRASAIMRAAVLPGTALGVVITLAWLSWIRTPVGRSHWDALLLRIPGIGPVRHRAATARVSAALASLLDSGIPIAAALPQAARAGGDAAVAAALQRARELVVHGERLSRAIDQTGALTPTAVRLVRAGEESGRLSAMLAHTAIIEQAQAEQAVRGAVRLLEPGLIFLFGGVIAFVAAALLQAVYAVRPS